MKSELDNAAELVKHICKNSMHLLSLGRVMEIVGKEFPFLAQQDYFDLEEKAKIMLNERRKADFLSDDEIKERAENRAKRDLENQKKAEAQKQAKAKQARKSKLKLDNRLSYEAGQAEGGIVTPYREKATKVAKLMIGNNPNEQRLAKAQNTLLREFPKLPPEMITEIISEVASK